MSDFYKPHRKAEWNYGGPNWKLSRSKIDLFLECPRCFYVDNKLGVARPPGFPFSLNSAVDKLLKKEFDTHRAKKTAHPLMKQYGIDDVWVRPTGELIVVDYKATSKDGAVNLDAKWQDGYKRQMEVYQWLFRQNGFKVSDTGYFVDVNGKTD